MQSSAPPTGAELRKEPKVERLRDPREVRPCDPPCTTNPTQLPARYPC